MPLGLPLGRGVVVPLGLGVALGLAVIDPRGAGIDFAGFVFGKVGG